MGQKPNMLWGKPWGWVAKNEWPIPYPHTPAKNPRRFRRYKHISLASLVVTFYKLRFDGVLRCSLARRRIGRLAYKGNLRTFNTNITHLGDALLSMPARYFSYTS